MYSGDRQSHAGHFAAAGCFPTNVARDLGSPEYVEYVATGKVTRDSGAETGRAAGQTMVHITSSPSGGEIYIDGKFFGNTPSDIALAPGEHVVSVTLGGKEWTRNVQITGGEIQLRAELP